MIYQLLVQGVNRLLAASSTQYLTNSTISSAVCSMALKSTGAFTRQYMRVYATTSSTVSVSDDRQLKMVLRCRRMLEIRSPTRLLHIKGVTFDNRQELVKQLVAGQPVMLVKEPGNPADPKAVGIRTLDGHKLGHVGRSITDHFPLQVCFGSVYSVGQGASGNWGALVSCCSSLHGLSLDFLPQSWAQETDTEKILGAEEWQELSRRCTAVFRHKCAISSTPLNSEHLQPQPHIMPRWAFDYDRKVLSIADFIPVAEPLPKIHQQLATAADGSAEKQEAVQALASIMYWTMQDAQKYVQFAEQQRQEVDQQGWQLGDLSVERCLELTALTRWPELFQMHGEGGELQNDPEDIEDDGAA